MSRHYQHTIVRLRAAETTDRYGNTKRDWSAPERLTVTGVNVQPAGVPARSDEDTTDRQVTVTGWHLSTPKGVDLDLEETDRVEWEGLTLQVDGKVGRWRVAGRVHHVEAALKEVD
ncbi:hypothetical protein LUW77_03495 [Streptomyces radiopugnans]|nr:hypothetical protein LUW77_03495 [Streptomyces radiopugnans]